MIQLKRNKVTVTVTESEAVALQRDGWIPVAVPPPADPQPDPTPTPEPVKAPAPPAPPAPPVAQPERPGAGFDWPEEAPSLKASRGDWRDYSQTLGIEPGVLNRGQLIAACLEVLEANK